MFIPEEIKILIVKSSKGLEEFKRSAIHPSVKEMWFREPAIFFEANSFILRKKGRYIDDSTKQIAIYLFRLLPKKFKLVIYLSDIDLSLIKPLLKLEGNTPKNFRWHQFTDYSYIVCDDYECLYRILGPLFGNSLDYSILAVNSNEIDEFIMTNINKISKKNINVLFAFREMDGAILHLLLSRDVVNDAVSKFKEYFEEIGTKISIAEAKTS